MMTDEQKIECLKRLVNDIRINMEVDIEEGGKYEHQTAIWKHLLKKIDCTIRDVDN